MRRIQILIVSALTLLFMLIAAPPSRAEITSTIEATVHRPFTVGQATLPPGQYYFHMMRQTYLTEMVVTNKNTGTSDYFLVRESEDSHVPHRTQLIFYRSGNRRFLKDVYMRGDKMGIAVIQPPREIRWLEEQSQSTVGDPVRR